MSPDIKFQWPMVDDQIFYSHALLSIDVFVNEIKPMLLVFFPERLTDFMNFCRSFIHLRIQRSKSTMMSNTRSSVAFMNSSSLIVPWLPKPYHSFAEYLIQTAIWGAPCEDFIFMPQEWIFRIEKEIMARILPVRRIFSWFCFFVIG